MESHTSSFHPRHRLFSVMEKINLRKIKALGKPHTVTSNVSAPSDEPFSSHKVFQASIPDTKPRPALHSNALTMRNYALQRSTKTPLRVPAAFPTNLNFSQQTFCLFDASSGQDEEGDLTCFLDDLFNGPPSSAGHANGSQAKDNPRTTKRHKQSLSGKLSMIHMHLKARKGSATSPVLPTLPDLQAADKSPNLPKLSTSKSMDLSPRSMSHLTKQQSFEDMDEEFKALFYTKPRPRASCYQEPKPIALSHIKPISPRHRSPHHRTPQIMQRITEDFEEEKEIERPRRRRSLSSPVASKIQTLATTPPKSSTQAQCPQIDIYLESSPFFNPNFSTLSDWSPRTPSTSQGEIRDTTPDSVAQVPTPSTSEGLGTPAAYAETLLPARLPNICSKFSMATGSPGIVNFNEHDPLAPHSLSMSSMADYRICLQSPPSLPSSSNHRPHVPQTHSRGPGADMFATLELLSELCQRSQGRAEEKDSHPKDTSMTE